jgi:hypothetical protein
MPSPYAIVGSRRLGSRTFSSAMKTVPPGNRFSAAAAVSMARRLLPIPPGPRRVTTRC